MNKVTKIIKNRKKIKYAVNERLSKEKKLTKKTVQLLKSEANTARKSFKDSKKIRRKRQILKSKIKFEKNIATNRTFKMDKNSSLKNSDISSKALNISSKKEQAFITKKTLKKAREIRNSRGLRGVSKRKIKQKVHEQLQKTTNQEDTLAEWNKLKRGATTRSNAHFILKGTVINTSKLTFKLSKGSYGLVNRSLNFSKGKGFIRTPINNSLLKNQQKKFRRFRQRLLHHKAFKATKFLGESTSKIAGFINNFFKTKNIIITLLIALLLSFFLGQIFFKGRPAIIQHEKELTEAYSRFTWLDAYNSDTKNVFYTDWNDALFYFNYRYGEFKANASPLTDDLSGEQLSDSFISLSKELWRDMNGEKGNYHFTPLTSLSSDNSKYWYLDPSDNESWQEMKREIGYESLDDLLESPFGSSSSIIVNKRYGYYRRGDVIDFRDKIEISVSNHSIYSPLTGTVNYAGSGGIEIESNGKAKIYIGGVNASSIAIGEQLPVGTYIGQAKRSFIEIEYEKYDSEEGWYSVNPEFYFPKIEYKQFTSLASKRFKPNEDIANRAKFIRDYLLNEGFSLEGIAAILGNFAIESNINPKRAEGDYLSPPIGATETSWDDDSWLDIGGMLIYGRYPNIIHRGLGLGQWTDTADGSVRQTMLRNYAKSKGMNWYDLELQLDFMLNGDISSARNILRKIGDRELGSSVPELTEAFLNSWEGNPGDKIAQRIQSASDWYNYFSAQALVLNGSNQEVYDAYKDKFFAPITDTEMKTGYAGNHYALGNCTWYVYNRMKQFGKTIYPYMGNANQWVYNYSQTPGASLVDTPQVGDIATFNDGVYGSSPIYGHVGFVEAVLEDGSFVMSEMNVQGEYVMGYRIIKPSQGIHFIRVE